MKNPIGHFTLLQETEKGLYFEAVIDEIEIGDRALTQYASGTLNQHSIGFRYVWDKCKFEDRKDEAGENVNVFVCYELQLFEGSVVTMGANENTMFEGVKSEDIDAETDKLNKEMDDTLSGVPAEKQYEIRQLVTKYIALAEHEPIDSLKEKVKPLNTDKLINAFKNL